MRSTLKGIVIVQLKGATVPRHHPPKNSGIVPPIKPTFRRSCSTNRPTIMAIKIEPDMLHPFVVYSWSWCNISLCDVCFSKIAFIPPSFLQDCSYVYKIDLNID